MMKASPFRNTVVAIVWGWMAIFVLGPALLLGITSLLTRHESELLSLSPTLANYARLLDPLYLHVLMQSLGLAGLATALCLLIGYPFAYALSRQPAWVKPLLLVLLMVPFWTNSLVRTFALKILFAQRGLINEWLRALGVIDAPLPMLYNTFSVVTGLVYVMLPFMVLPLYAVFEDLRRDVLQASQDLGANALQTFRHVVLPLTLPGIIAGSLLVFLPSISSFYVVDVLGGARVTLAGNIIKNQFLDARDWPFGAAASVVLTLLMGVLLLAYHQSRRHLAPDTRGLA
jgi:spermidine/putrescine transport system permease protein